MADLVTLPAAPSVWPAYLRTVVGAATGRRAGGDVESLRHRGFRLAGVLPAAEHVDRYRDVVGGGAVDRLPLLYPHLLGFGLQLSLMTQPGFPFPALGLVHVTNRVEATGPIPVGAALDVEVTVGEVRPHARGRTVDLVTVVHRDGVPVWTETSTYLHRGRPAPADGAVPAAADPAAEPAAEPAAQPAALPAAEPAAPVLQLSARRRLPGDLGRRYAAVSGDRNPIHLYPWTAKAFGFPRAIAHGMWSAAAVAAAVENRLPDAVRYEVQFRRPILLPGTVRLFTGGTQDGLLVELRGKEGKDTLHLSGETAALGS